jgi:4-amino-4-deoxy-L-arabinose transferase and related glycosyltransferases of PMT family
MQARQPSAGTEATLTGTGRRASDLLIVTSIAAAVALLHLLTNSRYGFHRDELQFLNDAVYLDWGFVPYPPLTPFLEHILLSIFGLNLIGLRLFAVLAQSVAVIAGGLMTRDFGGGRIAQIVSALAVAFAPLSIFEGTEFQYTAFDYLWWVLSAYFAVRLLKTGNPRWWLAIGVAVGLGLETKYAIAFLIMGILAGVVLSPARRYFCSGWFWCGIGVALLIFLPNFIWLVRHNFISYTFLQHIHARDVGEGRAVGFWRDQSMISMNLAAVPLAAAGLIALLRNKQFRMLAWMSLVPVMLFWIAKGRGYYAAGAYPVLIAMGAVVAERWTAKLPVVGKLSLRALYFAAFALVSAYVCAVIVPLAQSGPLKQFALKNNGDLREEFGWNELVRSIAGIRDSLPPQQRTNVGILVGNYGEAGAVQMLGPAWHLPPPISITNSAWLRGYPSPEPSPLIVVGFSHERADEDFSGCRLAGHTYNSEGVKNEESEDHPDIFVCDAPRLPWPEFWKRHQWFG